MDQKLLNSDEYSQKKGKRANFNAYSLKKNSPLLISSNSSSSSSKSSSIHYPYDGKSNSKKNKTKDIKIRDVATSVNLENSVSHSGRQAKTKSYSDENLDNELLKDCKILFYF